MQNQTLTGTAAPVGVPPLALGSAFGCDDLAKLRAFAVATADINPNLLRDIDEGTIRPSPMLMAFVRRMECDGVVFIARGPEGRKFTTAVEADAEAYKEVAGCNGVRVTVERRESWSFTTPSDKISNSVHQPKP